MTARIARANASRRPRIGRAPFEPAKSLERASASDSAGALQSGRTIAAQRGYSGAELETIAEMGYAYLRSGAPRFAEVLFEGLAAIDPDEPYYAIALGLTADRLEQPSMAEHWYRRAAQLDANDPRPDLNLAELALARGDRDAATALLEQARTKSRLRNDDFLLRKADALLQLIACRARPDRLIDRTGRSDKPSR